MLIFLILTVSAVGFCGFFIKWTFRDAPGSKFGLLPVIIKSAVEVIPQSTREKLSTKLIEKSTSKENLQRQQSFPNTYLNIILSFFAAIWILRSLKFWAATTPKYVVYFVDDLDELFYS